MPKRWTKRPMPKRPRAEMAGTSGGRTDIRPKRLAKKKIRKMTDHLDALENRILLLENAVFGLSDKDSLYPKVMQYKQMYKSSLSLNFL